MNDSQTVSTISQAKTVLYDTVADLAAPHRGPAIDLEPGARDLMFRTFDAGAREGIQKLRGHTRDEAIMGLYVGSVHVAYLYKVGAPQSDELAIEFIQAIGESPHFV